MASSEITKHLMSESPCFPFQFYFKMETSHSIIRLVEKWCVKNCQGRWAMIRSSGYHDSNITIDFQSAAKNPSPVPTIDEEFPPAEISLTVGKMVCFELECDATAFKLAHN